VADDGSDPEEGPTRTASGHRSETGKGSHRQGAAWQETASSRGRRRSPRRGGGNAWEWEGEVSSANAGVFLGASLRRHRPPAAQGSPPPPPWVHERQQPRQPAEEAELQRLTTIRGHRGRAARHAMGGEELPRSLPRQLQSEGRYPSRSAASVFGAVGRASSSSSPMSSPEAAWWAPDPADGAQATGDDSSVRVISPPQRGQS
jgi:hypothetical protein